MKMNYDMYQHLTPHPQGILITEVGLDRKAGYGYFEQIIMRADHDEQICEGGLWFDHEGLMDYDGVFELPAAVRFILEQQGIHMDECFYP